MRAASPTEPSVHLSLGGGAAECTRRLATRLGTISTRHTSSCSCESAEKPCLFSPAVYALHGLTASWQPHQKIGELRHPVGREIEDGGRVAILGDGVFGVQSRRARTDRRPDVVLVGVYSMIGRACPSWRSADSSAM